MYVCMHACIYVHMHVYHIHIEKEENLSNKQNPLAVWTGVQLLAVSDWKYCQFKALAMLMKRKRTSNITDIAAGLQLDRPDLHR